MENMSSLPTVQQEPYEREKDNNNGKAEEVFDSLFQISLADVRKSINFCRQVNMDILGLVENMSGLTCPHCGKMIEIFKTRGGMLTAKNEGLNLLGTLPFEPEVVSNGDTGNMGLLDDNKFLITKEFNKIVDEIVKLTGTSAESAPEPKKKLPARKEG